MMNRVMLVETIFSDCRLSLLFARYPVVSFCPFPRVSTSHPEGIRY
jgi:hypothetical protein